MGNRAATVLALLATLSACGGGGTTTVTAPPGTGARTPASTQGQAVGPAREFGDACRLLSAAEVQAALGGGPLAAIPRSDPQAGSFCTYAPADGSGIPLLTVQVTIHRSPAEARDAVDQLGGSPLTGIGDDARLSTRGTLGTTVYLARGATVAALTTLRTGVPQQALAELARTLAGRL
jgi:hypothetical protein